MDHWLLVSLAIVMCSFIGFHPLVAKKFYFEDFPSRCRPGLIFPYLFYSKMSTFEHKLRVSEQNSSILHCIFLIFNTTPVNLHQKKYRVNNQFFCYHWMSVGTVKVSIHKFQGCWGRVLIESIHPEMQSWRNSTKLVLKLSDMTQM